MNEAMESEFGVLTGWTESAVAELGPDHALPAACRGSGSPTALRWLADGMGIHSGHRVVDSGAGTGGPAAWLAERTGARPVCAEPMEPAVHAARRLFGLPSVIALAEELPFATASFQHAWSIGVLCTTTEKSAVLRELHRVLVPTGRLGLLVLVADGDIPAESAPEGNVFPGSDGLQAELSRAGFLLQDTVDCAELADPPPEWDAKADAVDEWVTRRHAGDPRLNRVREQENRMARLFEAGLLRMLLLRADRAA